MAEADNEKKMDQRSVKTRAKIISAFCAIQNDTPIEKISISQITAKAGVSRGAFYIHFKDVQDLMGQIVDKTIEDLKEMLNVFRFSFTPLDYKRAINEVVNYFITNISRAKFLFKREEFYVKVESLLEKVYENVWINEANIDVSTDMWKLLIYQHNIGLISLIGYCAFNEGKYSKKEITNAVILLDKSFDEVVLQYILNGNKQTSAEES